MKTPRQLLLERHKTATPQLDAVRSTAIDSLVAPPKPDSVAPVWWLVAWHELFGSARTAWTGLAALGLLALGLNLTVPGAAPSTSRPALPTPGIAEIVRERAQLLAELADRAAPSARPPTAPAVPIPRVGPRRSALERSEWAV